MRRPYCDMGNEQLVKTRRAIPSPPAWHLTSDLPGVRGVSRHSIERQPRTSGLLYATRNLTRTLHSVLLTFDWPTTTPWTTLPRYRIAIHLVHDHSTGQKNAWELPDKAACANSRPPSLGALLHGRASRSASVALRTGVAYLHTTRNHPEARSGSEYRPWKSGTLSK